MSQRRRLKQHREVRVPAVDQVPRQARGFGTIVWGKLLHTCVWRIPKYQNRTGGIYREQTLPLVKVGTQARIDAAVPLREIRVRVSLKREPRGQQPKCHGV